MRQKKQRRGTLRFAEARVCSLLRTVSSKSDFTAFCFCAQRPHTVHGRVTHFSDQHPTRASLLFFLFFSTMTSPSVKALDPAASLPVEGNATAAHPPAHKPDPTLTSNASQRGCVACMLTI